MNLYKSFLKRAIDVAASGCALLMLALPLYDFYDEILR